MQGQNPVREDIGKLNEDISTFKQEMMVRTFNAPSLTQSV